MNFVSFPIKYIIHPLWPILLYLFMAITTLHMQSPLLLNIHSEAIVLIASISLTVLHYFSKDRNNINDNRHFVAITILGLLFIASPLVTSLINEDYLAVLQNEEYKSLFKMMLFSPCLYLLLIQNRYRNTILNSIILSYFLFGLYFIYRYLILHETREYDLRPLLKIRHGDANFLCTFFAMTTPLSLMQAWKAKEKKKHLERCSSF